MYSAFKPWNKNQIIKKNDYRIQILDYQIIVYQIKKVTIIQ